MEGNNESQGGRWERAAFWRSFVTESAVIKPLCWLQSSWAPSTWLWVADAFLDILESTEMNCSFLSEPDNYKATLDVQT